MGKKKNADLPPTTHRRHWRTSMEDGNATAARLAAEAAEDVAAGHAAAVAALAITVSTFPVLVCGIQVHLRRVNRRQQARAHRAKQQRSEVASDDNAADEAVRSRAGDARAARAAATLGAAQDAAKRVRRSVSVAGNAMLLFDIFVMIPLVFVLSFNGMAFGPVVVAFVALFSIGIVAQADPTLPRRVRANVLGSCITWMFPLFVCNFLGLIFYFALAPQPFGLCSTRDPTCATAAHLMAGFFVVCALIMVGFILALLPTLYATRERALPPVAELLKRQRQVIAEDGNYHACHLRRNPLYLLEGAGYYAMPVHAALDRFFAIGQVALGPLSAALNICLAIALDALGFPAPFTWGGYFVSGLGFLFVYPTIWSRPVRRGVLSWLGRLGSRGEERQAAAVAALMGAYSPAKALARGRATFCGLPVGALMAADLASNADTGLHQRTVKLALGSCDAFMSHSWHDDADAKWAALQAWAMRFEAATASRRASDAATSSGRSPTLWLDKACIDQQDVAASLACLPVYLAGCQQLLVLAGKTYKERLWCAVEVFTFVRMGGALERVEITPLATADDLSFETFAVENTKCFDDQDKAKLLTAIEAAFGAYAPFNTLVRGLLAGASGGVTKGPRKRTRTSRRFSTRQPSGRISMARDSDCECGEAYATTTGPHTLSA